MLKRILPSWVSILALFLYGCDSPSSSHDEDGPIASAGHISVDLNHPGFLKVSSSNKIVYLGSNRDNVSIRETPLMKVILTYDFSIGRNEVTCGEFNSVMSSADYKGFAAQLCENEDLPVVNVSYFDAVLFSNARSRMYGLDSVYTYSSVSFDGEGHCNALDGLSFHPEREGFRLPTEAEWTYVAAQEWNDAIGWSLDNSGSRLHPVCTAVENIAPESACDMMGNAMEWVNDWMGSFRSKAVRNFVGAPNGGSLGERVVKGGSFRNEASSLHLYRRGDVYTVTSNTRSDYVGFRIAYGKIEDPTWLIRDGAESADPVIVLANARMVKSLTNTYNTKLVFRNDRTGNLMLIDFAGSNPVAEEFLDGVDAYHPDISPDGKRVAFCTGMEGVDGLSSVYVRSLKGSELVKLDVEKAAIPRWRVLENGDTVIVYVTSAGNNKDEVSFKKNSTWQVPFANGKFGTPEKLFDGAYHGGVRSGLAVTGARLLRTRVGDQDTLWYNGEQACNVSLSGDRSRKTLFLDFAGKTGIKFAERQYGIHEMLLIADSTGNLIQTIPSPAGYSFDHSEWISKDQFFEGDSAGLAVVTLTNANGVHEKIAVVDTRDSSVLELAQGSELWHPSLWAAGRSASDQSVDLDMDSAGVYLVPGGEYVHECVRVKMELLWKYVSEIEYFCVGSSRMAEGLIPDSITAGFALNMAHSRNDLNASVYFAENYGLNVLPNLKAIVIGVDFDLWHLKTHNSDALFSFAPGYAYDANHGFWKDGVPEYFMEAVENSYPTSNAMRAIYYESRGFSAEPSRGWGQPFMDIGVQWENEHPDYLEWNLNRLKGLVAKAMDKNVPVVGVIFPQNPAYRNTEAWGRYGPSRETARRLQDSVLAMTEQFPNFILLDENRMGAHDYTDEMASDMDHLSAIGAAHLSHRLDSLLKTIK